MGPCCLTPPRHLYCGRLAVRDQPRLGEVVVLAQGSRPRPSLFVVRRWDSGGGGESGFLVWMVIVSNIQQQ